MGGTTRSGTSMPGPRRVEANLPTLITLGLKIRLHCATEEMGRRESTLGVRDTRFARGRGDGYSGSF